MIADSAEAFSELLVRPLSVRERERLARLPAFGELFGMPRDEAFQTSIRASRPLTARSVRWGSTPPQRGSSARSRTVS